MNFKSLLLTALCIVFTHTAHAIDCPNGAPDVAFSTAYEGLWRAELPLECVNKKAQRSRRKRTSTLKVCIEDSDNGTDKAFTGTVRNKTSLKLLQDDGKVKPVGKRLTIACGVSLSSDDPSESAFLGLNGRKKFKNRTANMAIVVADEKDAAVANPGDLVATLGNCVSVVYKYVGPASCGGGAKK